MRARGAAVGRDSAGQGQQPARPGATTIADDAPFADARRQVILARVAACERTMATPHWYSFETAALLHGLWTFRLTDAVHLTQLVNPHIAREDDAITPRDQVVRHCTDLTEGDRTTVRGLPVTSLERTAVDCARSMRFPAALMTMDCALRHGADLRVVDRILRDAKGGRGVVQARQVRDLADPGSESPGESLVRGVLVEHGYPPPQTQARVTTALGDRWVDLGWPDAKVAVEFDGEVKYTTLAAGDPDGVRARERVRQAALEEVGWVVVRATWADLDEPAGFLGRLEAALHDRWHLMPEELPYVVGVTRWDVTGRGARALTRRPAR
ncbi:MAG: hypothetical protein FWF90_06065 [Promicromonosporaceae bacterium]|nr:hypothetical protein [Promicromonosporaceae bacterium]